MLNYLGNTNLVPNGYVYTSHTGSKYVFLEGLWFNNSSMKLVDPTTYGNMYISAQKQIVEHNCKNNIKIGQSYLLEGQQRIYIGEGQYTHDGIIVEETDKKDNPNQDIVPNGFVYNSPQGKKYFKKGGLWYSSETKKQVDSSNIDLLNKQAAKDIEKLNSSSPIKIGHEWTSKAGKTYQYVGDDRFISSDGKLLPKAIAIKVKDSLTAQKDDHKEENSEIKDKVDADIDDTSSATPDDRHEEEHDEQSKAIDDNDAKEDDGKEQDKIKALADRIKANPKARNIIILLTRADKLSLMAADILLSGKADEVKKILQTLNNRDE